MRAVAAILLLVSLVASPASWAYAAAKPHQTVLCPHESMDHGTMNHRAANGHPAHMPAGKAMAAVCCMASCPAAVVLPVTIVQVETTGLTADPLVDRLATAIAVEPAEPPPRT